MKMVLAHKCCYTSFSYAQIIHAGLSVNLHYEPLIKNKTDDVELLMADPDSLVSQQELLLTIVMSAECGKGGVCESLSCSCLTGSFSSLFFLSVRFSVCAKFGEEVFTE